MKGNNTPLKSTAVLGIAGTLAIITMYSIVRAATGCYIDAYIPCNNVPSKVISGCTCTVTNIVDEHVVVTTLTNCQKTVWFQVTVPCNVLSFRETEGVESGHVNVTPSQPRSCNAQGFWPDCYGTNSTGIIVLALTCNVSGVDLASYCSASVGMSFSRA